MGSSTKKGLKEDFRAEQILKELRNIVDPEDVDGPNGIADAWNQHLITLDQLEETLERYRRLQVLIEEGIYQP